MRVLITGGAGYIGSVLAPALAAAGHAVTVLDDLRYGQRFPIGPGCAAVRGDARDPRVVLDLLGQFDVVIALAAIVGAPACDRYPEDASSTNLGAIHTLCEALSPDQMLLFPNTNSGYGVGGEALCTEESPLRPVSLYGRTKVEAEARVMQRRNSIAFRFATVFGVSPRMRTDLMVNDFVHRAVFGERLDLYEGGARRNFVHIRDAAGAFAFALENFERMRGRVYNCGDDRANMTKAGLCDAIATQVIGFSWVAAEGRDPDQRDYLVSNERIIAAGWRPQRSLADGIRELIEFYHANGNRRYGNA